MHPLMKSQLKVSDVPHVRVVDELLLHLQEESKGDFYHPHIIQKSFCHQLVSKSVLPLTSVSDERDMHLMI